jgi:FMN-dependent NADH-azoreductase
VRNVLGTTDMRFIYAEGLELGGESESAAQQAARRQIEKAVAAWQARRRSQ